MTNNERDNEVIKILASLVEDTLVFIQKGKPPYNVTRFKNAMKEINNLYVNDIRTALADYMRSEGCSCCENTGDRKIAAAKLAALLNVPMYKDGSGYNFDKFRTKEK